MNKNRSNFSVLAVATLFGLMAPFVLVQVAAAEGSPKSVSIFGGPASSTDATPVIIDADVYLPEITPAPAVILAHGFGGSKQSVVEQANKLADAGFVVLAYSARGFGKSIGLISMNSPAFEVADVKHIITYLAAQKYVTQDSASDPRVGIAGGSYGGAMSLIAAGYDQRIDAVASDIAWNSLQSALLSQNIKDSKDDGVFKQMWTAYFFSTGLLAPQGMVTVCGRFSPEWCAAYQDVALNQRVSDQTKKLMYESSPISITDQITAPTLLSGGLADSLFPISEVTATAEQIHNAHPEVPIKLIWHSGGHDGGVNESERLDSIAIGWFKKYLADGPDVSPEFEVSMTSGVAVGSTSTAKPTTFVAPDFTGALNPEYVNVPLQGKLQQILAPAGGVPAAITVLPGLGSTAASLFNRGVPGQTAVFTSEPLQTTQNIIGQSEIQLKISSQTANQDAVFFASLRIVSPSGNETLPNGLTSAFKITTIGPDGTIVTVKLPGIVAELNPGDSIRLVVSTTDSAYRMPLAPAVYSVELADTNLRLATTPLSVVSSGLPAFWWPLGAITISLVIALSVHFLKPKSHSGIVNEEFANSPLVIKNLEKEFKGGVKAVNDVSFSIPAGKVIGLLGPNGAGKTTTMRMIMGLIKPTAGEIYVYGEQVDFGSPVLSRIGALVEGAGFLPHLSGRENLELFWKSSGRTTEDPRLDAVLAIADLGTAVDRKVRTYSQGMRQRLGIAQAMLGMPDLLMLDEPTNGLDPPQIRAMRDVMHDYAATGRTVIVSSHMLSEVEQTCSDVVVMHRGQLVITGEVDQLLAGRTGMRLEDFFLDVVGDDLTVGKS